jgi:ATP-binding cassette subfamily G (WHITE) protein 2 (SNQ2)
MKGETPSPFPTVGTEDSNEKNQALQGQPKLTKTFSWKHLNCAVSVSGERRLLLDDVSGFVAPGKLTALMGESGPGKVWGFFNVCRVPRF